MKSNKILQYHITTMTSRRLICVKFDPYNPLTNFYSLMQEKPKDTLFLYNENVEQFLNKKDVSPGGGNGVMRMYRADRADGKQGSALGIPTMYLKYSVAGNDAKFAELLQHVRQAFDQIDDYLFTYPNIQNIVWSADEHLRLGLAIAISGKRISAEQADALQTSVKNYMVALMDKYNIGKVVYNHCDGSITDDDMCNFLGIA